MTTPESYIGRYIDFDKAYGDQCVDLANQYCADNGLPTFTGGAAADMFGENPDAFNWITNTPDAIPPAGSIVIWNRGIGPYGHIAIVRAGSDAQTLRTVDQNWNGHPYAEAVNHNYNAVIGWGIPKNLNQGGNDNMPTIPNPDQVRDLYAVLTGNTNPTDQQIADWTNKPYDQAFYGIKDSVDGAAYAKKVVAALKNADTPAKPVDPVQPTPSTPDQVTVTKDSFWKWLYNFLIGQKIGQ